jgi:hypothetical protein
MANSLKSTFPALSRIVGYTPAALYARQRTFVEAGILESTPGRGPGSGVKATPAALAEFLIALITQAALDENVACAKSIAATKHSGKCPLTGASTFKGALAALLAEKALVERIREVRIVTNAGLVDINYDKNSQSMFLGKPVDATGMTIQVTIGRDTLRKLANVLKDSDQ